jgi:hypothetical protein
MKPRLSEAVAQRIMQHLLEKFGEPIGKALDAGPGVADERGGHPHKGEDPGNHGFGSDLAEALCQHCGMMHDDMDTSGSCCENEMCSELDLDEAKAKNSANIGGERCKNCGEEYFTRSGKMCSNCGGTNFEPLDEAAPHGKKILKPSKAMARYAKKRDQRKDAERAMRKAAKAMSAKDRREVLGVKGR